MNFQKEISDFIKERVYDFTKIVSEKYNIDNNELNNIWENISVSSSSSSEIDLTKVYKYTKPVLVELCKKRGLKHTGKTKQQLIELLTSNTNTTVKKDNKQSTLIFEKGTTTTEVIRKNNFGNYEYMIDNTRFIVDKDTNKIIGIQGTKNKDDIIKLCEEDIELIILDGKFEYDTPLNLDNKEDNEEELSEELSEEDVVEISDDEFEIEVEE
jgi:hypothetical protein